jgi:hypothetical protein
MRGTAVSAFTSENNLGRQEVPRIGARTAITYWILAMATHVLAKRLYEIQEEAREANEKALEELATDGIQYMVKTTKQRNAEVLRAYKNGGDALHQDKHLSCLKRVARVEEPLDKQWILSVLLGGCIRTFRVFLFGYSSGYHHTRSSS